MFNLGKWHSKNPINLTTIKTSLANLPGAMNAFDVWSNNLSIKYGFKILISFEKISPMDPNKSFIFSFKRTGLFIIPDVSAFIFSKNESNWSILSPFFKLTN